MAQTSKSSYDYVKLRMAAMTPEELKAHKAKRSAYNKSYRDKIKERMASMTPEELNEYKAKCSACSKSYREAKMASMTPKELKEYKAKHSDRNNANNKKRLASMTPEEKREWMDRRNEYIRNRRRDPEKQAHIREQDRIYKRNDRKKRRINNAAKVEIEYHYQLGEITRKERNDILKQILK